MTSRSEGDAPSLGNMLCHGLSAADAGAQIAWTAWKAMTEEEREEWLSHYHSSIPPYGTWLPVILPVAEALILAEDDARGA